MAKDIEKKSKKEGKHFFKDFKAELKKVIWPTPKQVVNNTIAVITIVLITAVIVFALDFVFKAINTYGIDTIRNIVRKDDSTNSIENEITNEVTDVNSERENTTSTVSFNIDGENAETVENSGAEE